MPANKQEKINKNQGGFFRVWMCLLLGFLMDFSLKESLSDDLVKSAIVFAPHQDDETLGCGGTIAKKKQAGAEVKIVFMTDGGMSSPCTEPQEILKSVRVSEALAAGGALGLKENEIIFLGYADGNLRQYHTEAVDKITTLLNQETVQEIFIPYYKDVHGDHTAANQIVFEAVRQSNFTGTVYEYPVWFWNHWPWVKAGISHYGIMTIKKSVRYFWPRLKDFNCFVNVEDFLVPKRVAFDQYKSQQEICNFSNGMFIKMLFRKKEVFCRYEIGLRGA